MLCSLIANRYFFCLRSTILKANPNICCSLQVLAFITEPTSISPPLTCSASFRKKLSGLQEEENRRKGRIKGPPVGQILMLTFPNFCATLRWIVWVLLGMIGAHWLDNIPQLDKGFETQLIRFLDNALQGF
ncbi:uncharacterized protein LOC109947860 [Prunus persica]|uniref:uncharacterized protein LOC109947487 n=1 Tax=Prunus persica TaxID=3760 RepID=UPI0009AB20D4|nr:uncharacterized protein LOC109947487 [Prunus persica]XP_020414691.1 uncharacterized protein LOC109947860 [Prunus persica]